MKIKIILSALIVTASGLGLAFAGAPEAAPADPTQQTAPDRTKEFKDILVKLVRQDDYLDEAINSLDAKKDFNAHELAALGLNLKTIANSLNRISVLNRNEFGEIKPGGELSNYTNAILSYSRKMERKTARIGALTSALSGAGRKASMRDAVGPGKGKKGGKKIAQLAEEQKALARLAADAKALRSASRNLGATSKWLYIASK